MSSPMSWSPDSRWLCYTVSDDPAEALEPSGWLLGRGRELGARNAGGRGHPARSGRARRFTGSGQPIRRGQSTVLIEESRWPLSAPAWGPRGKSLAFGRFVPQSGEPGRQSASRADWKSSFRGAWTRKRSSGRLPNSCWMKRPGPHFRTIAAAWSPDGIYLAVPRPGRVPSVDIDPDGHRANECTSWTTPSCRPGRRTARCAPTSAAGSATTTWRSSAAAGQVFGEPRELLSTGPVTAAPFWAADGRSILVVSEKTTSRTREFELVRCPLDSSEPARVLNLVPDPVRRVAKLRGIAIDFDKEAEVSFHAADLENRESELVWSMLRDPQLHRQIPSGRPEPAHRGRRGFARRSLRGGTVRRSRCPVAPGLLQH